MFRFLCRDQRVLPIVVDPGIYLARRTKIFHATQKRLMPDAFKVFTGKVYNPCYRFTFHENYIYIYIHFFFGDATVINSLVLSCRFAMGCLKQTLSGILPFRLG